MDNKRTAARTDDSQVLLAKANEEKGVSMGDALALLEPIDLPREKLVDLEDVLKQYPQDAAPLVVRWVAYQQFMQKLFECKFGGIDERDRGQVNIRRMLRANAYNIDGEDGLVLLGWPVARLREVPDAPMRA